MTEKKGKRQFTKEFKEDAVRLVVEGGRKASEVARDLGIEANMLHRWKRECGLLVVKHSQGKEI